MKHIGLVLSGGMGKGAYQIGALTAINEFLSPSDFEYVSAASIGALNTYAYLTENLHSARDIWHNVNFSGSKRYITAVLRSSFLQDSISTIISAKKIKPAFYVPLLDLENRELNYCNFADIESDEIEQYLQASVAMPFYNRGITIGRRTLYDGAVIDNIPIYPVLQNDLDYVICIYFDGFNYIFEGYQLDNKIIKITFPDNSIISNSICISHTSIEYMIEEGYKKTKAVLDDVFNNGTEALDDIYSAIKERNLSFASKDVRITGDVIVTNMNKLTKKAMRRKKIIEGEDLHE